MGKRKRITGGRRLREWARKMKRNASRPLTVEVGFFPESRYPDGRRENVAAIAAMHEYGIDVPERAFMRPAAIAVQRPVRDAIRKGMRGRSLDAPLQVPEELARRVGGIVADRIRANIEMLRDPRNAPATAKRKGTSDPLEDTGVLADSVEVRVMNDDQPTPKRSNND